MDRNRIIITFFTLFLTGVLLGQSKDRYMVFFTDKDNTPYSVSEPLDFLNQRSIDRREKHSITTNMEDLPVDPVYVEGIRNQGADVYFTSRWMNAALVEMIPSVSTNIEGLSYVAEVEFVAPGSSLSTAKNPIEKPTTFTEPTGEESTDVQLEMLGADDMHADGHDGDGVLVAVFDGGFLGVNVYSPFQHLYNEERIVAELDFVANSDNPYTKSSDHGTRVLSCIAGKFGSDFSGTSPNVDVILAVTEQVETEYRVEEYNWLIAAEYADSAGVDIINSSLGYTDFDQASMNYTYEDMDGETAVISQAANFAYDRGILVVNSAGNSGSTTLQGCLDASGWCYIGAPADSPKVLAIGSVDADGVTRTSFSSFGPSFDGRTKPDVMALGSGTIVAKSNGTIGGSSGTSFSSPLMAGFAASLLEAFPDLTNWELMELIKASAPLAKNPNNEFGYGVPNYLIFISNGTILSSLDHPISVFPNPMEYSLTIQNSPANVTFKLMDLRGTVVLSGRINEGESQLAIGNNIKSGIYFLQLQSEGFSETIKLLKK